MRLWVLLFPFWGMLLLLVLVVVLWWWLRRVRCSPWVSVPLVSPLAVLEHCRHVARGWDLGCGGGIVDAVRWRWHGWDFLGRDLAELRLPPPSGLVWILQGKLRFGSGHTHICIPFGGNGQMFKFMIFQRAHVRYNRPPCHGASTI